MQRARLVCGIGLLVALAFAAPFLALWFTDRRDPPRASRQPAPVPAPVPIAVPTLPLTESLRPPPAPPPPASSAASTPAPAPPTVPLKPDPILVQVRETLLSSYFLPISHATLTETSVTALIDALGDPYTEYLEPAEFRRLVRSTSGRYGGLGLYVGPAVDGLVVTAVSWRPGEIRRGDVIVSIDGMPVNALGFEEALTRIRGEPGTTVHLSIRRPGEVQRLEIPLVRHEIEERAVTARPIKAGGRPLGYVQLRSFPAEASEQLRLASAALLAKGAEGLVIDLRGNPGGLVEEAVAVASVFLPSGPVGSTNGFHRGLHTLLASGEPLDAQVPLVVLVDEGSASAAEMVAVALAESRRAVVVGKPTYGKAAIQAIRPLPNGAALRFTSALYTSPSGTSIAGTGVQPAVHGWDNPLTTPDEALRVAKQTLADLVALGSGPRTIPF
jgi:carboxyl-terminal processing protease